MSSTYNYKTCSPNNPRLEKGKDITYSQKRHKRDTKTFEELDFQEQANSLNANLVLNLPKAIRAHVRKGKEADPPRDPAETLEKCIKLVVRLKDELDAQLKKFV